MSFIVVWKVAGLLVSPKNMTSGLESFWLVQKAAFHCELNASGNDTSDDKHSDMNTSDTDKLLFKGYNLYLQKLDTLSGGQGR